MQAVKLKHPHTHAGREYPAGATLTLREDRAEWLIALDVAEPDAPTPAAPAASRKEKQQ